jgi:hypothetical protein
MPVLLIRKSGISQSWNHQKKFKIIKEKNYIPGFHFGHL